MTGYQYHLEAELQAGTYLHYIGAKLVAGHGDDVGQQGHDDLVPEVAILVGLSLGFLPTALWPACKPVS